jgi:hypothetical protein
VAHGIRWVGVDMHAHESTIAIFDQVTGELTTRRVLGGASAPSAHPAYLSDSPAKQRGSVATDRSWVPRCGREPPRAARALRRTRRPLAAHQHAAQGEQYSGKLSFRVNLPTLRRRPRRLPLSPIYVSGRCRPLTSGSPVQPELTRGTRAHGTPRQATRVRPPRAGLGGNVSKLLRTNSDPQERAQHREAGRRFRHSIGITNNSLLRSLRLRDSFEHSTDELEK